MHVFFLFGWPSHEASGGFDDMIGAGPDLVELASRFQGQDQGELWVLDPDHPVPVLVAQWHGGGRLGGSMDPVQPAGWYKYSWMDREWKRVDLAQWAARLTAAKAS